jgi:hypothetical protein
MIRRVVVQFILTCPRADEVNALDGSARVGCVAVKLFSECSFSAVLTTY